MSTHSKKPVGKEMGFEAAKYYDGPSDTRGDVGVRQRVFAYATDSGTVAGVDVNVMFTVDRSAKQVWPYLRDFNLWQNAYGYFYSGIVGDLYRNSARQLGDETFRISIRKPGEPAQDYPYSYRVLKVIPERLIVLFQPVPENGDNGGVSPGFHVFMLNERDGKTVVTCQMEHASRTPDVTVEEALAPWRKMMPEYERFWRDIFIPNLKKLI